MTEEGFPVVEPEDAAATEGGSPLAGPVEVARPRSSPWLVALAVLAVVGHLLALYLPGSPDPGLDLPGLDKIVHLLLFAAPVWLLGRSTGRVRLVAGVFAGHAVVSELVQHRFLPRRSGDPLDLLADLVGIGIAVLLLRRVSRLTPTDAAP